ncbi:MAG: hypothetical protein Q4C80_04190 [Bacillota bacterium]|nr:hypothetical protein [Bacillota bacterium]
MINSDEDALICDFLETYHVLNYRSLPAQLAATLAAGLRDTSRIATITTEGKASTTNTILAAIADRLGVIMAILMGNKEAPPSIFNALYEIEQKKISEVASFRTGEEYESMWLRINGGT